MMQATNTPACGLCKTEASQAKRGMYPILTSSLQSPPKMPSDRAREALHARPATSSPLPHCASARRTPWPPRSCGAAHSASSDLRGRRGSCDLGPPAAQAGAPWEVAQLWGPTRRGGARDKRSGTYLAGTSPWRRRKAGGCASRSDDHRPTAGLRDVGRRRRCMSLPRDANKAVY
jgi:hypothetical protein